MLSGGRLRCSACCRDAIPITEIKRKMDTAYAINLVVNGLSDSRLERGGFVYRELEDIDHIIISPKELAELYFAELMYVYNGP